MADGKVIFEYVGDTSGVDRANREAEGKVKGIGSKLGSIGKGVAVGIGAAAVSAGVALLALGKRGMQTASDLSEVQNVVDTTFGKSAKEIDAWSAKAGAAFGLSALEAKNYTGTMGAMLKSMGLSGKETVSMSEGLAGLAGDMSSFYNLEHDEAWEKIRSGIAGETEPLKALGINMSVANLEAYALSQGITTSYNAMSESEKTTLRYNYLMQATADAQGDFAKTSDSWANQLRIASMSVDTLAAGIGDKLLPAFQPVLKEFNKLATESGGDLDKFIAGFDKVVEAGVESLDKILPMIIDLVGKIAEGLIKAIPKILPKLVKSLVDLVLKLVKVIIENLPLFIDAGIKCIIAILQGIVEALPQIIQAIVDMIPKLIQVIIDNLPLLIDAGLQILLAVIEGLVEAIPQIVQAIIDMIPKIVQAIIDNLPKIIEAGIQILLALIVGIAEATWKLIEKAAELGLKFIEGIWKGISGAAVWLWENISGFFVGIWEGVKKIFNSVIKWLSTTFTNAWNGIWTGLGSFFEGIWNGMKTAFIAVVNFLIDALNGLIDAYNYTIGAVGEFFGANIKINKVMHISAGVDVSSLPVVDNWQRLAVGMPYVPYNNLPALLHKGEAVLTAEENAVLNSLGGVNMLHSMLTPAPAMAAAGQTIIVQPNDLYLDGDKISKSTMDRQFRDIAVRRYR